MLTNVPIIWLTYAVPVVGITGSVTPMTMMIIMDIYPVAVVIAAGVVVMNEMTLRRLSNGYGNKY